MMYDDDFPKRRPEDQPWESDPPESDLPKSDSLDRYPGEERPVEGEPELLPPPTPPPLPPPTPGPMPASMPAPGHSATHGYSRLALAALGIAVAAALLGAAAGFGSRIGVWHFRTGFEFLRWAVYGAIGGGVVSVAALYWCRPGSGRRGFAAALLALAVSLVVVAIPLQYRISGRDLPPIHDITTDLDDPPEFVAIVPLRADASNPPEYAGAETGRLQWAAYPDIRPLILDLPPERAFQRALDIAESKGWEIVGQDIGEGRIEATDRTFWFGFRDDVVIRLTPLGARTVVDVRSKSREGRGDVGTNAQRIREYLRAIDG